MKVIIAGGRDHKPTEEEVTAVICILKHGGVTEIVQGGAKGVDEWAAGIGIMRMIPVKEFKPDWDKYGKMAGPIRNKAMAEYADACILLTGGRGTDSMRREAKAACIPILYDSGIK